MDHPLKPRKRPRQARSRALVDAILEGAARVVDREGLAATTNRIAVEAGVSIGSLYQYFPNKEALLLALAERHLEQTFARLQHAAAEADGEALEPWLRALIDVAVAEHRRHPRTQQLIRELAPRSPALMAALQDQRARLEAQVVAALQRHRPELAQPQRRAHLLFAAFDGALHSAPHETAPDEVIAADLVRVALACLTS